MATLQTAKEEYLTATSSQIGQYLSSKTIQDMYQFSMKAQSAWITASEFIEDSKPDMCYELECQINNIQKVLDNRSTILLI